jgi:hypothetical protein
MKVTGRMVDVACDTYRASMKAQCFDTGDGVIVEPMQEALEAAIGIYKREHSRWERFSEPEISVIAAAISTLDTDGAPTEKIEYAQRLVNETRAVMRNEAIPKANRWDAFSYEEIEKLMYGLIEAESEDSHPGSDELRERLTTELDREHTRRKSGYQGPGVYEISTGRELEVLGRHGEDGGIVLRDVGDTSGHLYFETWNKFNYLGLDDTPTYRYLRPLGGELDARG